MSTLRLLGMRVFSWFDNAAQRLLPAMLIRQDWANHYVWGSIASIAAALLYPYLLVIGMLPISRRLFVGTVVVMVALTKDVLYDLVTGHGTPDPRDVVWTIAGGMPVWVLAQD